MGMGRNPARPICSDACWPLGAALSSAYGQDPGMEFVWRKGVSPDLLSNKVGQTIPL